MVFPIFIEKALEYVLPYAGLAFQATNESIPAIMEGLQIQQGDRVLAVCGSGDQAFAMLELADYVTAVDSSKLQILYAKCRLAQIKRGDFKRFHTLLPHCGSNITYREQRSRYFTLSKLQTLKLKVDRLRLERGDMYKFSPRRIREGRFNKIYLSNLLCYGDYYSRNNTNFLDMLVSVLPCGGLIYTVGVGLSYGFSQEAGDLPLAVCDTALTNIARNTEIVRNTEGSSTCWNPTVFRRVKANLEGELI